MLGCWRILSQDPGPVSFVQDAMLADVVSMVTRVDHQRIVAQFQAIQFVKNSSQVAIDGRNTSQIVFGELFNPGNIQLGKIGIRDCRIDAGGPLRFAFRKGCIRSMWFAEMQGERERTAWVLPLEFERVIGQQVDDEAVHFSFLTINCQLGV